MSENSSPSPKRKLILKSLARDILSLLRGCRGYAVTKLCIEKTPARSLAGSMTVEAAIVLPVFMFFFLNLSASLEMMRLHGNLDLALFNAGSRISSYGAVFTDPIRNMDSAKASLSSGTDLSPETSEELTSEESEIISEIGDIAISCFYIKNCIISELGETYLAESPLKDGSRGLNFPESEIFGTDDTVDLILTYRVCTPFDMGGRVSFRMCNRYFAHLWNGYGIKGDKTEITQERIVYITEDSEVYHTTENCTHLKLRISEVDRSEIEEIRNENGGRYRPCEICAKGDAPDSFYIGAEGDRYHYSSECRGLKRTYVAVPLSDVADSHRPCSRCGGK